VDQDRNLPVFLFAGDSVTEGSLGESYVGRLAGMLEHGWAGHAGLVVNAGCTGETVRSLLQRIDGLLREHRPRWLILAVGTNDVWLPWRSRHSFDGWILLHYRRFRFDQRPTADLNEFTATYRALIDRAWQVDVQVLACTPSPLGEQLASPLNCQLARLNGAIRQVAAERGLPLADVWQAFVESLAVVSEPSRCIRAGLAAQIDRHLLRTNSPDQLAMRRRLHLTFDGRHLNSRGADLWAHTILAALLQAEGQR
jgi:lysophospholipase L1-like esterase